LGACDDRLGGRRRRGAVISTCFVAAYVGLGLPAVLTGLISVPVGPVDASTYVSGLAAAFVVVAFAVGVRVRRLAAPRPASTPCDSWCNPGELAGAGAGRSASGSAPGRA